jgi:hypothetical protein
MPLTIKCILVKYFVTLLLSKFQFYRIQGKDEHWFNSCPNDRKWEVEMKSPIQIITPTQSGEL